MTVSERTLKGHNFSAIDREFGKFCARHSPSSCASLVAIYAALVSRARTFGDSCLAIDQWANTTLPSELTTEFAHLAIPSLPDLETSITGLQCSPMVGLGKSATPLVLTPQNRLYLYRYWQAEKVLAQFISSQQLDEKKGLSAGFKTTFQKLFGPFSLEPDWQAVAALAAVRERFTLITGGPGTGKTTTVVRLLALLLQEQPQMRIAVAAPTGKAVARLNESLNYQIGTLPKALTETIPRTVQTLHRLLGYQPKHDRFGFNGSRKLPFDAVVVDEASMVDILLMASLVRAMPAQCRLILLGDHQQLASVDAGNILADLCSVTDLSAPHSPEFCTDYRDVSGQNLPSAGTAGSPLRDNVVMLRHSRRFDDQTGLGGLSAAIREGRAADAIQYLEDPSEDDVHLLDPPNNDEALLSHLDNFLREYFAATSIQDAFGIFNHLQLLTGLREGRWGVTGLNNLIEKLIQRRGHTFYGAHYHRRPIMVTRNDYHQQLFNGDIGLCWQDDRNSLRAFFPTQDQGFRSLPLIKLPPVESAWALTVHKSQGSEFDQVILLLPPHEHPLCTRELLYTGLTRARKKATLFATDLQVTHAIDHTVQRVSGLAEALARELASRE